MTDGLSITASAMAPLEFARAIVERLQVHSPAVLEAWYEVFSTRESRYCAALLAVAEAGHTAAARAT